MAERTEKFHLGQVVKEKNAHEAFSAIEKILSQNSSNLKNPQSELYKNANSTDALDAYLKELLRLT